MNIGKTLISFVLILLLSSCGGASGNSSEEQKSSLLNTKPIAIAGDDQISSSGETITLQGSGTDADGDSLTYSWSFISKPSKSNATIQNASSSTATFIIDESGEYRVQLIVSDGKEPSEPDSLIVTVNPKTIRAMIHHIALLDGIKYSLSTAPNEFKYAHWQGTIECKENTYVNFFIGQTKIGEHSCDPNIFLANLTNEGVKISDDFILNVSWLLQALDRNQKFIRHDSTANGLDPMFNLIETMVFDFNVSSDEFISTNNIRSLIEANLDKYESLDWSFMNWDKLSDIEKVDKIIGTKQSVSAYYNSYALNYGAIEHSADSNIEQGFPYMKTEQVKGVTCSYKAGAHNSVLVGNVDNNTNVEIIINKVPCGQLFIINSQGEVLSKSDSGDLERVAIFNDVNYTPANLLVSQKGIFDWGFNTIAPLNYLSGGEGNYPPSIMNLSPDLNDEIIFPGFYSTLNHYKSDGSLVNEFSCNRTYYCSQEMVTPAVGDFDKDGEIEVVTTSKNVIEGIYVFESNGTIKNGFPIEGYTAQGSFPVVGDVDGDEEYEIIILAAHKEGPVIKVFNFKGELEYVIEPDKTADSGHSSSIVLADLNNDNSPEIILGTPTYLNVYTFSNSHFLPLDGFPQRLNVMNGFIGGSNFQPVVGDVDGDRQPDIILLFANSGISNWNFPSHLGRILAYNNKGKLLNGFPKVIDDFASPYSTMLTPAIADIDGDGRNEIIIGGATRDYSPVVYVYDLGGEKHGNILWGQFGKDAKHSSFVPLQ